MEEELKRELDGLHTDIVKSEAILNNKKNMFILEIKNGLGDEIKNSDNKPIKIKEGIIRRIIKFFKNK